ncbi:MAG: hypothetical protein L3J67_06220 [Hyphomicrobiaceae bacterium]|nr:hypothetical protein [Hyphomicrobiaceae bacterium]
MSDEGRFLGGEALPGVAPQEGEFAHFSAPYRNAQITLIDKPSSEVPLMELRIREGRRITIVDLDAKTVGDLGKALSEWADKNK